MVSKRKKILTFPHMVKRASSVVKIQRRKRHSSAGTPYDEYTVLYYLGGKRTRKNCSTLDAALALADIKASELSRGEIDAAQFSGSARLSYGQALETLRPVKVDLNSAALEYAQAKEILGEHSITEACRYFMRHHSEELTSKPVNDVCAEFIQQRTKAGLSDRYIEDLRYRLGAFSRGFVCEINQITPNQVELWLDALGLSARSHNNNLRVLSTFFKFAKMRKYLSKAFDPLEGIMRKKEKVNRVPVFTAKELALLLDNASQKHPDYLASLVLGAFAGFRQSEIERLSWEDIERSPGYVEAEASKTKTQRRRLVEIKPVLAKWLALCPRKSLMVWPHSTPSLNKVRAENAKQAKVKWQKNGLRHTWVSCRLAETSNAAQVATEAGNSPQIIYSNYRELMTPAQAKAWFSVVPPGGGKVVSMQQSKSA